MPHFVPTLRAISDSSVFGPDQSIRLRDIHVISHLAKVGAREPNIMLWDRCPNLPNSHRFAPLTIIARPRMPFKQTSQVPCNCSGTFTMPRPPVTMAAPSAEGKITCTCGRAFKTDNDLRQHQRDSPLHPNTGKGGNEEFRSSAETRPGTTVSRTPMVLGEEKLADDLREEKYPEQQHANFRDEETFPTFTGLPEEDGINLTFYDAVDGFSYLPQKHWCFLAEIVAVEQFFRVKLIVRDKAGATMPVAFYTDGRGTEFAPSQLQPGNTVAILYAHRHGFLDLTTGIRQEECSGIKVRPL